MGRRGPKPQTKEMQDRKGNPGKRKNRAKPAAKDALSKLPATPKYLSRIAGAEWRRAGAALIEIGKLTRGNLKFLEAYCYNYGVFRECLEKSKVEEKVLNAGKNNYKQPNPFLTISKQAQELMIKNAKVINDTISSKPEPAKDPLKEFMKRGGKIGVVKK